MTDFSKMCEILNKLYAEYRDEEEFQDFIQYNDLGLPIAYLTHEGLVTPTKDAERYVAETWRVFMESIGADEEDEFDSLEEILTYYYENNR